MNGKQLKNSILQWAIQGKLVPQDPNDEPASVLLERIRKEKERLVKEKKIKKDKNASIIFRGEDNSYYEKFLATGEVKCIDEEIPFEIPNGWEWCRMQDVMEFINGRAYKKEELLSHGKYKVLRVGNFFTNSEWYYSNLELPNDKYCYHGDLLYAWSASFGPQIWDGDKTIFHYHIWNVKYNQEVIFREYLYYFFLYDKTQVLSSTTGSTMIHVSMENMKPRFIPIPPRKEQIRIVDKIGELLSIVDKYAKSQEALERLNIVIFNKLKKSILQEAIQGKLVSQIQAEGTAEELLAEIRKEKELLVKEGKLKKSALTDSVIFKGDDNKYWEKIGKEVCCIDDEIPFEIPETWVWVRLNDICSYIQRGKSPKYSLIKKYPVVAQKCNQWSGFSIDKAQFIEPSTLVSYGEERLLQDGELMWNSTGLGTLGRMAIYWSSLNPYGVAVADSHVTVIRALKQFVQPKYLYYYFSSNTVQSVIEDKADGSTKQKELSTATIKNYILPLPPLTEQQRIVAKIEELASIMSR